jgi:hypothetical protein
MQVFLDDFSVYGNKKDHLKQVQKCLEECRLNGISLNLEKCAFSVNLKVLFGHIVCHDGLLVDLRKITTIIIMPVPTKPIEIKQFLGGTNFYRHYFQDFASETTSMCKLLRKDEEFKWTDASINSWECMKASMTCLLVLIVPNWKFKFHVHIDASNFSLKVMLGQNLDNTIDKPIYYVNRLMNNVEKKISIIEKEALAMIYVVKKFRHYLLGNSFVFYIDHQSLLYLVNKPMVIHRIVGWLLLLQEFDFKVVNKLGRIHFVLDHLSQIGDGEHAIGAND